MSEDEDKENFGYIFLLSAAGYFIGGMFVASIKNDKFSDLSEISLGVMLFAGLLSMVFFTPAEKMGVSKPKTYFYVWAAMMVLYLIFGVNRNV